MMSYEFLVTERNICPFCGSTMLKIVFNRLHDDRYGQPDYYDILECQNSACHIAFVKQEIAASDLAKLYSKYYHHRASFIKNNEIFDVTSYVLKYLRDWLCNTNNLYARLETGQKVLDIGCGYGPSKFFLKKRKIKWTGLEVDHLKVELIQKRGLVCHQGQLKDFQEKNKEKYDVILLNQVIEHISDPLSFFKMLRKTLNNNGCIILATPNYESKYRHYAGRLWVHWHVPYHQFYFSIRSLNYLSQKTGFEVNEIFTRTPLAFFVVQKNIKPCIRGYVNDTFTENFKLSHLTYYGNINNLYFKDRVDEDCIYAKLTILS